MSHPFAILIQFLLRFLALGDIIHNSVHRDCFTFFVFLPTNVVFYPSYFFVLIYDTVFDDSTFQISFGLFEFFERFSLVIRMNQILPQAWFFKPLFYAVTVESFNSTVHIRCYKRLWVCAVDQFIKAFTQTPVLLLRFP